MSVKVNQFKDEILLKIEKYLTDEGYEVLRVPISDNSTSAAFHLAFPTLDEENNEASITLRIMANKQKRDGTEYDPYEENQRYLENCELVRQRKERAAENKKKKNKNKEEEK